VLEYFFSFSAAVLTCYHLVTDSSSISTWSWSKARLKFWPSITTSRLNSGTTT
jgi:hypothetical protein